MKIIIKLFFVLLFLINITTISYAESTEINSDKFIKLNDYNMIVTSKIKINSSDMLVAYDDEYTVSKSWDDIYDTKRWGTYQYKLDNSKGYYIQECNNGCFKINNMICDNEYVTISEKEITKLVAYDCIYYPPNIKNVTYKVDKKVIVIEEDMLKFNKINEHYLINYTGAYDPTSETYYVDISKGAYIQTYYNSTGEYVQVNESYSVGNYSTPANSTVFGNNKVNTTIVTSIGTGSANVSLWTMEINQSIFHADSGLYIFSGEYGKPVKSTKTVKSMIPNTFQDLNTYDGFSTNAIPVITTDGMEFRSAIESGTAGGACVDLDYLNTGGRSRYLVNCDNGCTFVVRMLLRTNPWGNDIVIFEKALDIRLSSGVDRVISCRLTNDGGDPSAYTQINVNSAIDVNTWHTFACRYDGIISKSGTKNVSIFKDSTLESSIIGGNITGTDPVLIGGGALCRSMGNLTISHFAVFNYSLTDDEVIQVMDFMNWNKSTKTSLSDGMNIIELDKNENSTIFKTVYELSGDVRILGINYTVYNVTEGEAPPDTTDPYIINHSIQALSNESATINFTYSENANITVLCNTTYLSNISQNPNFLTYSSLVPNSTYFCNVTNFCDVSENCNTTGYVFNFTTSENSPIDTCTYSGSGAWIIDCSENCEIIYTNLYNNYVEIINSGVVKNVNNIFNYSRIAFKDANCIGELS